MTVSSIPSTGTNTAPLTQADETERPSYLGTAFGQGHPGVAFTTGETMSSASSLLSAPFGLAFVGRIELPVSGSSFVWSGATASTEHFLLVSADGSAQIGGDVSNPVYLAAGSFVDGAVYSIAINYVEGSNGRVQVNGADVVTGHNFGTIANWSGFVINGDASESLSGEVVLSRIGSKASQFDDNDFGRISAAGASIGAVPAAIQPPVNSPPIAATPANQTDDLDIAITPWTLVASDPEGAGALAFTSTGLPNGVTLDSATGEFTGTPTVANVFGVVVTVTDADGKSTQVAFTWTIDEDLGNTGPGTPGSATSQPGLAQPGLEQPGHI